MTFDRHTWNREKRYLKKELAKAIKQRRKRSHIRERLVELGHEKMNLLYGGFAQMTKRIMMKQYSNLFEQINKTSYFSVFLKHKEPSSNNFPVPIKFKK